MGEERRATDTAGRTAWPADGTVIDGSDFMLASFFSAAVSFSTVILFMAASARAISYQSFVIV